MEKREGICCSKQNELTASPIVYCRTARKGREENERRKKNKYQVWKVERYKSAKPVQQLGIWAHVAEIGSRFDNAIMPVRQANA
jgi:hypothetical protein